jgi:F0F1-type ATP synthase membrane subunit b/b'
MVTIVLELDKEIERKARDAGLLTSENLAALIEAELERKRQEAANRIIDTMDKVSASFRARYPDLTEDEALAMIDQWIDEADQNPDESMPQ